MNKPEGKLLLIEEKTEKNWQGIYRLGGVTAIIFIMGILLDMVIGNIWGGDLTKMPQTAVERFLQFQENWLMGSTILIF